MTQELIKQIQQKLGLTPDGIWGPKTAKAFIQFQKTNGIEPDGLWSKKAGEVLFKEHPTITLIKNKCVELGVTKPEQIQYIIATVQHETGGTFEPISELGGDKYLSELYDPVLGKSQKLRDRAVRMGNTKEGDGVKYKGRGFVQLTWQKNYAKYSIVTGVDLVNNPDLALDPKIAVHILVHGMKYGTFTGKRLDHYINNHGTDFINARRIINGTDKAKKIALLACSIRV